MKIIAVTGSPDSGKTAVAFSLAARFAEAGTETIVLCADRTAPTVPAVFPRTTSAVGAPADKIHSLGKITKTVEISEKDILDELVSIPNRKHLGFLGYAYGENGGSYPPLNTADVENVFQAASKICGCMIVDCVSGFSGDAISSAAIAAAGKVICVGGCRYKDIVYYASQAGPLTRLIYGQDNAESRKLKETIIVLNKVSPYDAVAEVDRFYPHVDLVIPYDSDVREQFFEGTFVLKRLPKKFEKGISRLFAETGELNNIGG